MNMAWSVFSLLILISAIMIGRESRQSRHSVRIEAALPVTLFFDNGAVIDAVTEDASIGGLAVRIPSDLDLSNLAVTEVELRTGGENLVLPVKAAGAGAGLLRMRFLKLSFEQRMGLSVAVLGRSDAWETEDRKLENSMVKAA